jgi:hypothetical protein
MTKHAAYCLVFALATSGCAPDAGTPLASGSAAPAADAKMPLSALPAADAAAILAHTKALSEDAFEGRKPGSAGEEKTVAYISAQFQKLGLRPGNTDGTYVQNVPLVGITGAEAKPLTIAGKARATLKWKDDVVAWTKHVTDGANIANSEMVFVRRCRTRPIRPSWIRASSTVRR